MAEPLERFTRAEKHKNSSQFFRELQYQFWSIYDYYSFVAPVERDGPIAKNISAQ
jgi:hypothetical protein